MHMSAHTRTTTQNKALGRVGRGWRTGRLGGGLDEEGGSIKSDSAREHAVLCQRSPDHLHPRIPALAKRVERSFWDATCLIRMAGQWGWGIGIRGREFGVGKGKGEGGGKGQGKPSSRCP
eukprot:441767-Rhodomonas_salina.7